MKKIYVLIASIFMASAATQVQAKALIRVKALGSSPRGQFVAFEEFGYKNGRQNPFSKIRVMNVWKNKYVEVPVEIIGTQKGSELEQVRAKAKQMAIKKLQKYNIST